MMRMNQFVKQGLMVFGFALALPLAAQNNEQCTRLDKLEQWMKDSLDLNADQTQKIAVMHDSACAKILKIRRESEGDRDAIKSSTREVMKQLHGQYKTVLTESQMQRLHEHRKAAGGKGHKNSGKTGDKAEKMTSKMKDSLNLTEAQEAQILLLNRELVDKRRELMGNATDADRDQKKKEMKAWMKTYNERVKAILNDEQDQKWETWKASKRKGHHGHGRVK